MGNAARKGKFSSYGANKFGKKTKNTQYFSERKEPTLRGAFPRPTKYSILDEGVTNARVSYSRGMDLRDSAMSARSSVNNINLAGSTVGRSQLNSSISGSSSRSRAGFYSASAVNTGAGASRFGFSRNRAYVEGNAAVELEPELEPEEMPLPLRKQKRLKKEQKRKEKWAEKQRQVTSKFAYKTVRGAKRHNPMQTTAISPALVTLAKFAAVIVVVVALVAFARITLSSATVATGVQSQNLTNQIEQELVTKSNLEVVDSSLGNSSKIRTEANALNLVSPTTIEQITLSPDMLAKNEDGSVSLVGSLNKVSQSAQ